MLGTGRPLRRQHQGSSAYVAGAVSQPENENRYRFHGRHHDHGQLLAPSKDMGEEISDESYTNLLFHALTPEYQFINDKSDELGDAFDHELLTPSSSGRRWHRRFRGVEQRWRRLRKKTTNDTNARLTVTSSATALSWFLTRSSPLAGIFWKALRRVMFKTPLPMTVETSCASPFARLWYLGCCPSGGGSTRGGSTSRGGRRSRASVFDANAICYQIGNKRT